MSIFGICFILYFLKLSACHDFLVSGVDQFLSDRKSADFPRGVYWCPTKKLTKHCSSSITIVSYEYASITLGLLTEIFMQSSQ